MNEVGLAIMTSNAVIAVCWLSPLSHTGTTGVHECCYKYNKDQPGLGVHIRGQQSRNVGHNFSANFRRSAVGGEVPIPVETPRQGIRCIHEAWPDSWFRIGFDHKSLLRPAPNNFLSVSDNPTTVDQYISSEVAAGHLMVSSSPHTRWNPIGIIPKLHQPGKFRLIVDLSAPHGNSVNDGIDPDLCSLEYITVDQAARLVARYGRGALMAKTDLQAAYRTVPVHPRDQHLIGLEWGGATYQDKALPFGLRSAPKLFTAVGDCLTWALVCEGVHDCVHYLDDFYFRGPPACPSCRTALDKAMGLFEKLGLPVAPAKTVGPSTVLTFLGIEIDSMSQELKTSS